MKTVITKRVFLSGTVAALAVTVFDAHLARFSSALAKGQKTHHIDIKDFEFLPAEPVVRPGDRIIWTNRDIAPHTATAADKSWDSKLIRKDKEWQMDVTADMATAYFCRFHPNMKARLTIVRS